MGKRCKKRHTTSGTEIVESTARGAARPIIVPDGRGRGEHRPLGMDGAGGLQNAAAREEVKRGADARGAYDMSRDCGDGGNGTSVGE